MNDSPCPHLKEYGRNPNQWKYWRMIDTREQGMYWHLKRICRACLTIQTKRLPKSFIDLDEPRNSRGPTGNEAWIGVKRKVGQSGEAQAREM